MESADTCYTTKQVKLGVKPDELKPGDILAYHRTAYHSEGFRVLILKNDRDHKKWVDEGITLIKTVILFSPIRKDFKVGDNYSFWSDDMMVTKWRIV